MQCCGGPVGWLNAKPNIWICARLRRGKDSYPGIKHIPLKHYAKLLTQMSAIYSEKRRNRD